MQRCDVRLTAVFKYLSRPLSAVAGASALLVAWRALAGGPIASFVTIARPLNLESAAAVALLLAAVIRSRESQDRPAPNWSPPWMVALALVLLVTLASYWKSLWFPFVSDDYVIVSRALRGELLRGTLTQGDAGVAFRPLTRFLFAAQGWIGSSNPVGWHSAGLALHLANCVLVFRLARDMVAPGPAVFAAALFGLHALHPEAVSWMNSRSDALAAFFLLSALVAFLSHDRRRRWWVRAAALLLMALAILSKESAYAFVPLAWFLLAARRRPGREAVAALLPFATLEAGLFAYRWWVLGGVGGYVSAGTGRSVFLDLNLASTAKALLWRMWAVLLFPVNWSVPTAWWLGIAALLAAAGIVALTTGRPARRAVWALAGLTAASVLPVLPLALVGVDLLGARLYYLPSAGFALLVAVILDGVESRALRAGAAGALLAFHFAALHHELRVWDSVTALARRTCIEASASASGGTAKGLPDSIDGVFFLGNGFPECVELHRGDSRPMTNRSLRWDPERRRLVPATPE